MLLVHQSHSKSEVFAAVAQFLAHKNLAVLSIDDNRPWGGFFVLQAQQSPLFIENFFENYQLKSEQVLSPKILIVCPQKRLSWQYHQRRSEIWKLIAGSAGAVLSPNDTPYPKVELQQGQILEIPQGYRHRLLALDNYGIIAEIWQHTQPQNPSDENDIIRLADDFGR